MVCHKDHVVGYEDYVGKCLLCVVEDLMREVGRLTAVCKEKEWVGLTDEEINAVVKSCNTLDTYKYFRAIEAKLKEKNT